MKVIFVGANNPQICKTIAAVEMQDNEFEVVGFIDNDPYKQATDFYGYPVLGGFEIVDRYLKPDIFFVNLITRNTQLRYETSKELVDAGAMFANCVHPGVNTFMVELGTGNSIEDSVLLQAGVQIGNNCAINTGTIIAHECKVGHSVFFAPGAALAGKIIVEDGALIGTNATILPRLRIGRWATVGAGAVVTRDVPDYAVVAGNPARVIKYNEAKYQTGNILSQ